MSDGSSEQRERIQLDLQKCDAVGRLCEWNNDVFDIPSTYLSYTYSPELMPSTLLGIPILHTYTTYLWVLCVVLSANFRSPLGAQ